MSTNRAMKSLEIRLVEKCNDCSFNKLEMVTKNNIDDWLGKIRGLTKKDAYIFFTYCEKENHVTLDKDDPRPKWCPLEKTPEAIDKTTIGEIVEHFRNRNEFGNFVLSYSIGKIKSPVTLKTKFDFIIKNTKM